MGAYYSAKKTFVRKFRSEIKWFRNFSAIPVGKFVLRLEPGSSEISETFAHFFRFQSHLSFIHSRSQSTNQVQLATARPALHTSTR